MTKEKSEALKAGRNLSSTIETNIQNEDVDSKELLINKSLHLVWPDSHTLRWSTLRFGLR